MDAPDDPKQEGHAEARAESERQGRARMLLKRLTHRFGPVPTETQEQVMAAKEPALNRWALRVFSSASLQAVFEVPKRAKKPPPARKARRA